ncbi:hypothetical protein Chor_012901 [Crotalus horridus]
MNLISMAAAVTVVEPELKWVSLWLRSRWAAVLAAVLAALLVVLLPVLLVEEQCQAALQGWAFLRSKLGLGYMGIATYTGQTTELSVTSGGLELMSVDFKPILTLGFLKVPQEAARENPYALQYKAQNNQS